MLQVVQQGLLSALQKQPASHAFLIEGALGSKNLLRESGVPPAPLGWYYMTCGFSRAPICTPWFYFKLMFLVQSICFVWHCHCSCYYYSTDTIVPISMPIPMLDWTCTWLTNQKRGQICPPCHMAISGYIAKLSINFNYILVESWDSFILN